jgi:hypothetical protein
MALEPVDVPVDDEHLAAVPDYPEVLVGVDHGTLGNMYHDIIINPITYPFTVDCI